jgi:hypothetical protein
MYNWVREATETKLIHFESVRSEKNVNDILTKALKNESFHRLMKKQLFLVADKTSLEKSGMIENIGI